MGCNCMVTWKRERAWVQEDSHWLCLSPGYQSGCASHALVPAVIFLMVGIGFHLEAMSIATQRDSAMGRSIAVHFRKEGATFLG